MAQMTAYKQGWQQAFDSGDEVAKIKYNALANELRSTYDYYGGTDGSLGNNTGKIPGVDAIRQPGYSGTQFQQMAGLDAYIRQQNQAAVDKAKSSLTSAYNQNLLDADATRAKLAPMYTEARNQTAGSAALGAQNFNEYAAAGLNSGAGGQAQLAMNNALLGQMGGLNQQEAAANQSLDFETQRIKRAYHDAIAEAEATGNWQLAQALYGDGAQGLR